MKEKKKSINSKLKKLSIVKLFAAIVLLAGIVFSLTRTNTISNYLKSKLAAGDVPTHEKTLTSNGDGTYKLSLTVKGDAEEKSNDTKANVIVILDTSGSMDWVADNTLTRTRSNTGGYCGDLGGNDYRRVYYRTGTSGNYKYYPEGTGPDTSSHSTVYYKTEFNNNGSINWQTCGSSYRYNYTDSQGNIKNASRLEQTKVGVKKLVKTLLDQNTNSNNIDDMIELSLITFSTNAHYVTPSSASANGWIKGSTTTSINDTIDNVHALGATNWDEALYFAKDLADAKYNSGDHDKTYVVFFSDGEPTQHNSTTRYGDSNHTANSHSHGSYLHGGNSSANDSDLGAANYEAKRFNSDRYDFYGIFAYGDESRQNYMRTVVSYANYGNNNHSTGSVNNHFYSANNETEINSAFESIASSIANAVGITDAEIHDGTTAGVVAKSGTLANEGLLQVDQNSYEYWMTIPLTNGKFTVFNNYNNIGSQTFTVSQDGEYVNITWGTGTNEKTARYKGEVSTDGSSVKIRWGDKNSTPSTAFYFAAPQATYVSDENADDFGSVNWDLDSVDTLLNGVTYEVTFDVWPTQTTLDLIADAKNEKDLPENVKPYLDEDGNFKTNTGAKIVYDDTRNGTTNNESNYTNPNPVKIQNAETLSVTKTWSDEKHESSMKLYVNRKTGDKNENYHEVILNNDNDWNATVYISYGIMKADKTAHTVELVTPGHDFSFAEPEDLAYNWEFNAPVVHPMIINAEPTLLTKVETKDLTCSMEGVQHCTNAEDEFYKIGESYYKVTGTGTASLTAENIRKSTIDVKKVVEGADKNPDQLFTYNVKLNTNNANEKEVWFSIFDSKEGVFIINTNSNSYVDTATLETFKETDEGYSDVSCEDGYVTYTKTNANGTTSTNKVKVGDGYSCNPNSLPTGYYYTSNPADVSVSIKESWGLRFINVPTGSTYTIKETNDGGDDYRLKDLSLKIDDTKITTAADKTTATITGNVESGNTYHLATFTNEYLKTHVDVEKIWSDNNNQDGKREPVTVELYRNNQQTGITKTLPITQPAKATFDGLAKFDADGNNYTYKVVETTDVTTFGYTKDEKCTTKGEITSCTITNSHTPEPTSVSGTKTWSDDENRDNLRPDYIMVQLNKTVTNKDTNERVTTPVGNPVRVDASTSWNYSWSNLPKYEAGEEIVYTVTENVISGYVADYSDGYNITNNHSAATTDVTVTKIWDDDDDRDGKRPQSIDVTITPYDVKPFDVIPGTTPQVATVTLNEDNSWTYTWTNLFVNTPSHQTNQYTVKEESIAGYESDGPVKVSDNAFVFEITNTHEIIPVEISGTKTWDDDSNRDGKRPESITIKVLADDTPVKVKDETTGEEKDLEVTISAADAVDGNSDVWAYSLGDLPKYRDGGEEIEYTVEEKLNFAEGTDPIPAYTRTDNKKGLDIVNTYTPEMYENETGTITISKVWDDDNNRDGLRKDVTVILKASTASTASVPYDELSEDGVEGTYTFSKDGNSTQTIPGLYKYYEGEEITYDIEETTDLERYEDPDYTGSTKTAFKVTNKHTPELYENETGTITISKVWDDDDNRDGLRKDVTVILKASTASTASVPYDELSEDGVKGTYTFSKDGNSTQTISGLYKKYNGEEITYDIEETTDLEGYEDPDYTGSTKTAFKVTNKHTPELYNDPDTGELKLTKIWDDDNNNDGLRTDVTFKITATIETAEGTKTVPYNKLGAEGSNMTSNGEFTITVAPDNATRNSYTVTKLYKKYQGVDIDYKVSEIGTYIGYRMVGKPDMSDPGEFIITNKHDNNTKRISGVKTWKDEDNRDGVRPESITIILNKTVNGTTSVAGRKVLPDTEADNPWAYIFTDLPINEGGKPIVYTITEEMSNNSDQYSSDTSNENEVINTHDPFSTDVTVTKVWDDADDQDGLRKNINSVTVTLSPASFKPITGGNDQNATQTLSDENDWTHTWTNLYKMSGGKEIAYTVTESPVPEGYEATVSYAKDENGNDIKNQLIVTNKHTPALYNKDGKLTVTKIWDDDDNRDNKRGSVTVELTATTDSGLSVELPKGITNPFELNEANDYKVTIKGLAKYYKGEEIRYSIAELSHPDDYTPLDPDINTAGNFTITNKLTPEYYNNEKGEITITKSWEDDENRDGLRKSVDVQLIAKANGEEVSPKDIRDENSNLPNDGIFTLEADEYTVTVTGLYANYKGNPVEYTIKEITEIDGYNEGENEPTYTQGPKDFIVKNYHTPYYYNNENGEITITKSWDDDNNRDGLRDSVQVQLIAKAKGEELSPADVRDASSNLTDDGIFTLAEADDYTVTVTGLYMNYDGNPIEYTIKEITKLAGYNEKVDPTYTQGPRNFIVENHHEIETATVTITKSWIDDNNVLGTRPETVTMHLFADGTEVTPEEGVTLNATDNGTDNPNVWEYKFEGLPVNSSNGKQIDYTVSEDDVANYTGVCPDGELTCINTVKDQKQEIKVVKTWDDNSDQDGKRDDQEAKVTLVGTVTIDGETEEVYRSEEPLVLGTTNPWEGSFTNIPIFHNGYRITYNIEENDDELNYYSLTKNEVTENQDTHEISFEITNKHEIITEEYTVTKTWNDEDDNDGMRPESITIQLLDGNGNAVEYKGQTEFTLTDDNATEEDSNKWSFTFENLPVYSEGQEINYTVVEKIDGDKYVRTDDLTTLDIINTHKPEIIDFTINKVWSDDNDRDGKRPDSITIQLLANGEKYGDPVTLTIDNAIDENKWSYTFEGLPKYIDGNPVEYTISEESVPYYTPGEVTPVNNTHEGEEYTDGDTYEFDGELENTHIPELINEDDDDPDNDGQITVTKTWDDEDNKYSSRPESITVLLFADGEEIGSVELSEENNWTYTFYEDYDGNPLYKYKDHGIEIVYYIGEIEVANYETLIDGFNITNKYNGPVPEITPPNTGIIYSNKDNSLIELFILFITLTSTVIFRKKLED